MPPHPPPPRLSPLPPPPAVLFCPLCPWDPVPPDAALPSARALAEHVASKHDRPADDASDADLRMLLSTTLRAATAARRAGHHTPRGTTTTTNKTTTRGALYCQRCDAQLASIPALRAHARAHARVPCEPTGMATANAPCLRAAASVPLPPPPVVARTAMAQAELLASVASPAAAVQMPPNCIEASRFHCPARQCPKSFSRKDTLVKHYAAKHRPRPRRFRCLICEEQFTSKYDLARHHVRVHSGRPKKFACDSCGAGFNQKSQMTMHKQRVHKDKLQKRLLNQQSPRRALPPPTLSIAMGALVSDPFSRASSPSSTAPTPLENEGVRSPAAMDGAGCADLPICHQRRRPLAVSSPLTPSGD